MGSASAIREPLDERPELEPAVEQALEADEPFTFDDLAIDTGRFGDEVAADIVEETGDGYVVADRQAVTRGLAGDGSARTDERRITLSLSMPEPTVLGALGIAIAFVIVFRFVALPSAFRDGTVVLSGNDPYYYRYWVEQLIVNSPSSLETLPTGSIEVTNVSARDPYALSAPASTSVRRRSRDGLRRVRSA